MRETIMTHVGEYAARNQAEFISEVFAAIMHNKMVRGMPKDQYIKTFDEAIMKLYNECGGIMP